MREKLDTGVVVAFGIINYLLVQIAPLVFHLNIGKVYRCADGHRDAQTTALPCYSLHDIIATKLIVVKSVDN
jgi:hypothetical protein